MADTNRTLNQSITSEFTGTYGFESARNHFREGDLVAKEERMSRTSMKSIRSAAQGSEIELGQL